MYVPESATCVAPCHVAIRCSAQILGRYAGYQIADGGDQVCHSFVEGRIRRLALLAFEFERPVEALSR